MSETETHVLDKDPEGARLVLPGIKLTVVDGPDRGLEGAARRAVVRIGTAPDNDLVLRDPSVSRHHVELRARQEGVLVLDLGSTNGTLVDGVRVIEALLSAASLIKVGGTSIRATPADEPVVVPISPRERLGGLLGRSVAMREVFAVLERVAPTDATVLIEGESGTGKELAAEAIHALSTRADGPFEALDCGAIAPTLVESEIFGHLRGAFTGAVGDRLGAFERADGGTLFLDEVGELPLDLQPKLLRILEKREVRRLGGSSARRVDVRVVAATNRDLAAEVNRGAFREDLYYRLAVVRAKLPPLRARPEDIPLLVRHFLEQMAPDHGAPSAELVEALAARPWPGNVRELRNAVERAVAMTAPLPGQDEVSPAAEAGSREVMRSLFALPFKEGLERWTAMYERAFLEHVLRASGGSVSGAARLAGVNRRFVQRLMRRNHLPGAGEEQDR